MHAQDAVSSTGYPAGIVIPNLCMVCFVFIRAVFVVMGRGVEGLLDESSGFKSLAPVFHKPVIVFPAEMHAFLALRAS